MGSPTQKSYFHVFYEDTFPKNELLKQTFGEFRANHKEDAEVKDYNPKQYFNDFDNGRKFFELRRLPAFAVSDVEEATTEGGNFVTFDRGMIQKFATKEELYDFISDIHYIVRDENILRVKKKLAEARFKEYLRIAWDEIKDFISINISK